MLSRSLFLLLTLSSALFASPAFGQGSPPRPRARRDADDSDARMHFQVGAAYHERGRFREAAHEFERAYELSRRPQLLYNLFVAYRDAAQLREATDALRRYLALVEDVENRDQLEARLAAMEQTLRDEEPEAEASTSPERPAPGSAPAAASSGDTWIPGWILAGVGGASIVGGIVTAALALDAEARLAAEFGCRPDGACRAGFEATRDEGALLAGLTDGLWIGGGVIVAAGVVLALVLADSGGDAPSAGAACGPEGCAAFLEGRF